MLLTEMSCRKNTHVKHESPISYGSKVMINVKSFQKVGERPNVGTD